MNKEAWLKFIKHSTEAHHIREIFNGTFGMIDLLPVQKLFFDRIDHLLTLQIGEHTRASLINLREDIEHEIEFSELRNKTKLPAKNNGRPSFKIDKTDKVLSLMAKIRSYLDEMEELIDSASHSRVEQG